MTTTTRTKKGENLAEAMKEEGMKKKYYSKDKAEKKENESFSFNSSHSHNNYTPPQKSPSAPTLHNPHHDDPMNDDEDLQMVVINDSHSHSHSHSSIGDDVVKEKPKTMTVMDIGGENVDNELQGTTNTNDVSNPNSKEERKWYKVLLGLRIVAFVLCKLAFSVMASDNQKFVERTPSYWLEGYYYESIQYIHWYYLREFKYCFSVNVIGLVYSGLQICDLVKYLITKRHTMDPKLRGYFNIAMDQGMAYLLMSASSSAATRAYDLRNTTGVLYKFMEMANVSVAFSLVAFVAFVSSSIVSGFILFRFA